MKYKGLAIKRDEVLYDVNFISWKTAKCRVTDTAAQAEAQTDDENHAWFERQLATAVDHLKGKLKWCIHEHTGTITDNTIKTYGIPYGEEGNEEIEQDPTEFYDDFEFIEAPARKHIPIPKHVFRFRFSDAWQGNFEALSNYIHRYIVDYILYEWFKITMPNEAAAYLVSSDAWESKVINEARNEKVSNVYFRL
jgi:hypothetical protein